MEVSIDKPPFNSPLTLNTVVLPISPAVFVESDTMFGVCLPGSGSELGEPLLLVSSNVPSGVLFDRLIVGSCDPARLPSQVSNTEAVSISDVLLHVHANVGK